MERCCHCIPLWLGCLISSLVLFAVDLLERPLPYDMPCCQTLEGILFVMIRICNILHITGCFALFVASFVGQGFLVKVFLGTTALHFVMQPVHLLTKFLILPIFWVDMTLIVLGFVFCVYIWIVAHAYLRECREDVYLENETRFSRYKISTVSTVTI
ncbi:uncharacterized protein [Drosophila bipectinata]|uniref:uncharacterized protein n=1 Tax=Drosophila bipectinata TaxID=42026 RepID=UPI0007E6BAEC|nr:uncharacterized protein LOC108121751 [Drosophila bipectinata]